VKRLALPTARHPDDKEGSRGWNRLTRPPCSVGAAFGDIHIEGVSQPLWLGDGADDAYGFVFGAVGWIADGLATRDERQALSNLRSTIAAHARADGVHFDSAAWFVTSQRA
jgi:hypothetical protein